MGDKQDACERLMDSLEDAINSLERGKEECEVSNWDLFDPDEIEEVIEMLREMASRLHVSISQIDEHFSEE